MAPKRAASAASQPCASRRQRTSTAAAANANSAADTIKRTARTKAASSSKASAAATPKAATQQVANAAPKRGAATKPKSSATVAAASSPSKAGSKRPVDEFCAQAGVEVVGDYDVTLNQTNISDGHNNNKFYRLQMLVASTGSGLYSVWTRWGRVGVPGSSKMLGPFYNVDAAIHEFKSKFRTKTGHEWEQRASIQHKPGKYVPVEIDHDAKPPDKLASPAGKKSVKYKPSALDAPTQDLISLILDNDMFTSAMKDFEIDVDRFPLGQLSKAQVAKGQQILQELKDALNRQAPPADLAQLSSRFYTTIPHAFGMRKPPVLGTTQAINAKVDMCNVLADIEIAQSMLGEQEQSDAEAEEQEHPADEKYALLEADLQLLGDGDSEMPVIKKYIEATVGRVAADVAHVWRVRRKGESERFAQHGKLSNRRLLWHGTNVAVVAAILKSGLRIMAHSGGRVGKGIYLASEHAKSAGYVRCGRLKGKSVGVMFLAEAALGKEHSIDRDSPSLVAPPAGFDSVIARGQKEPDPKKDTTISLDGKPVKVPQGPPVVQQKYANSSFYQSEYLLYQESQATLRYILTFDFKRKY